MAVSSQDPTGRVISLDNRSSLALIEVDAAAICARCASGKGCGAGLLGRGAKTRRLSATIPADLILQVGDTVCITLAPVRLLQATLLVYGAPLAGAALGAVSALQLQLGEPATAVSALLGLGLGWVSAKRWISQQSCSDSFTPSVSAQVDSPASSG